MKIHYKKKQQKELWKIWQRGGNGYRHIKVVIYKCITFKILFMNLFLLFKIREILIIKGEKQNMNKRNEKLFNYKKLLTDIQKESGKSQEELSVDMDCTASHISNVKNGKSTFSFDRTLRLLNKYGYCIENYLENENNMAEKIGDEYSEWRQDVDIELQLLMLNQVEVMIKFNHTKAKEREIDLIDEGKIKRISENIRRIRIEKRISIKEMCKSLKMKETTYRNIENGSNRTTIDNYAHIANILDVPLTVLLGDSLKNKEALVAYQLKKMFSMMNFIEKREMKRMMKEMAEVFNKYKKW